MNNNQYIKSRRKVQLKELNRGMTILYTGEGKGKTTAALGLVLRAVGYGKKVLIVQFGKTWFTGELEGVKKLAPLVKMYQGGLGFVQILDDTHKLEDHIKAAQETFDYIYKEAKSEEWDLIIADELVGSVAGGLIKESQVVKLIKEKAKKVDLVLTGHHAKKSLINKVDLATEMVNLKHPYEKGFIAKPGVDY
jgi:cob(I)alamin adenosyltransferase